MWLSKFHIYIIAKLCRQQAEVIQNHKNATVLNILTGQGKAMHRKCKRLKLGSDQVYDH
jgi:hypothetical protein